MAATYLPTLKQLQYLVVLQGHEILKLFQCR